MTELEPDQETREALAKSYWGAGDHLHRNWSNILPGEQNFLLERWRKQHQPEPVSTPETMARVVAHTVHAQVAASLDQFRSTVLPQLLSHEVQGMVARSVLAEIRGIDERQRAQASGIAERLDQLGGQIAKIQAYDGKSHAASLDVFLSELQGEVRDLQREVGMLKGRIR